MRIFVTIILSILFFTSYSQSRVFDIVDESLPDTVCVAYLIRVDTTATDSAIHTEIVKSLIYMYNTYWDNHTESEYAYVKPFGNPWVGYVAKDYPAMYCSMFDMPFRVQVKIYGSKYNMRINTCVEECSDLNPYQNNIEEPEYGAFFLNHKKRPTYRKVPFNEELDSNGIYYNINGQRVTSNYIGLTIEKIN